MSIKILIADDHRIVRDGLRTLIETQSGMQVVGEAETGRVALKLTRRLRPDVVVMDINMPDLNGIEAARQIIGEFPDTKVIAFSMYTDEMFISEALKAGIKGYLQKDSAFEELVRAIRTVTADQIYLSAKITGSVVDGYVARLRKEESADPAWLSGREREVVQLYAEGRSTKEIADHLNLSVKTIEANRRSIMEKLGINSIAELTKYAIRTGLTIVDK